MTNTTNLFELLDDLRIGSTLSGGFIRDGVYEAATALLGFVERLHKPTRVEVEADYRRLRAAWTPEQRAAADARLRASIAYHASQEVL